jgi:hypothetical protein
MHSLLMDQFLENSHQVALMAQRNSLFWLTSSYVAASGLFLDDMYLRAKSRLLQVDNEEHDATQLALDRTFSLLHRVMWFASISYLISSEFARLYCDGETIGAHYLRKFARFLTHHEKYSLAAKVLALAVRWNVMWLGPTSKSNGNENRKKKGEKI